MKKDVIKILIALALFLIAMVIKFENEWINNGIFIVSYIIVGFEILRKAVRNIFRGKVFDENFLMSIATLGAFAIGEFPEAVAVMLFYQVGELFQDYAVDKSRKSIASLMDIRPDYANIIRDGKEEKVDPSEVRIGDTIIIKPGEKVPLDGVVVDGKTTLDTKALTGESVPRGVEVGDQVLSGCINLNGVIKVKVTKEYGESTVSKILDLVENASSKKAKSENFITKFAAYYTPIVVIIAIILAIVPPLIIEGANFQDWLYRALSFLVVSCPCALVISIPLSFFGGIGGASKMGVLVKGSNYLEALSNAEIMVFDKTGTLTEGVFEVQNVEPIEISKEELLKIAAYAEYYSNHPISKSIKKAYNKEIDEKEIIDSKEISGKGIEAKIGNQDVLAGNEKLMNEKGIEYTKCTHVGSVVYVAIDGKYVGHIVIADKIKEDAKRTIEELRVEKVEELLKTKSPKGKLAFVGDGINDAPVLAMADIGIAMGGLGADSAIEAADIVIMTDQPSKIISAIKLSKKTMRIVRENIIFAIAVKVLVLILTAVGLSSMWQAVFADVGVSIIAILNALRALRVKNIR